MIGKLWAGRSAAYQAFYHILLMMKWAQIVLRQWVQLGSVDRFCVGQEKKYANLIWKGL